MRYADHIGKFTESLISATSASKTYISSLATLYQIPNATFPQFQRLPLELRIKIWEFALEPRVHWLHVNNYRPGWLGNEESDEGDSSDDSESLDDTAIPNVSGGQTNGLTITSNDEEGEIRSRHMVITSCSTSHSCGCDFYPPRSRSTLPLPTVLFVCHESRNAGMLKYSRCLEDEYDFRGRVVRRPVSGLTKSPPSTLPRTGLIFNSSIDTIVMNVNVASITRVKILKQFARVIAEQMPNVRKVGIRLVIALSPGRFGSAASSNYWRNWGVTGWWIPIKSILCLPALEEVVMVRRTNNKTLPLEWVHRIEGQWIEELLKVKADWPMGWKGTMPTLEIRDSLDQKCG